MAKHILATTDGLVERQFTEIEVVQKEWGEEDIIYNDGHCVKMMEVTPGYQVSMHWHNYKDETFILLEGQLIIETISKAGERVVTVLHEAYSTFTIHAHVPHTFYCPKGQKLPTYFLEASSQDDKGDSYRVFPSGKIDW